MNPKEKQQEFYKELKQLLVKYGAEITIEDLGINYFYENKIVVDFSYDESLFKEYNTGIVPQLILGTFENGK